ncbi:MAG: hypothetical protein OJF58_004685 [Enhydrobacter sp.]|nr:MAG: hypothetical protein OJF58_004685 [Enhydrobacter sp.]
MEPDAPELRERLVALRLQRSELDRDIARLQENLQTGRTDLSAEKLKTCRSKGDAAYPRAPKSCGRPI